MSVLEQDLTASEQSMSKAIAQAWLSGVSEGTMIGDMPLPAKPDDLQTNRLAVALRGGLRDSLAELFRPFRVAKVPLARLKLHL